MLTDPLGPEVVSEAVKVLEAVNAVSSDVDLKLETHLFGGCAIDETGEALPAKTLTACKEADAILMGTSFISLLVSYSFFNYTNCVLQALSVDQNGA